MRINKSLLVLISYFILFILFSIILNQFHLNINQDAVNSIITISSTLLSIGFAIWIILITVYNIKDDAYLRGKLIQTSDILLGLNATIAVTTCIGILSLFNSFFRIYTVSSILCNGIISVAWIILLRIRLVEK